MTAPLQPSTVPYVAAMESQRKKKKKKRPLVYDPLLAPNFYQISPMDIAVISAQLLGANS